MIDAATGSFVYDGNLKRAKQTINGKTIYTVYSQSGAFGRLRFLRKRSASLYRDNVTDNERTSYVGRGTGIRLVNGQPRYTHKDHLGSPIAETGAFGNVVWKELYTPFGLKWTDPAANRDNEGYTGHIEDDASGLTYMQARYYDPALGRFLSNDPVGFAEGGPGYFNRYSYTLNNPISFIDPDGTCTGSRLTNRDGTCKATGGSTTGLDGYIQNVQTNKNVGEAINNQYNLNADKSQFQEIGKAFRAAFNGSSKSQFNSFNEALAAAAGELVNRTLKTGYEWATIIYELLPDNFGRQRSFGFTEPVTDGEAGRVGIRGRAPAGAKARAGLHSHNGNVTAGPFPYRGSGDDVLGNSGFPHYVVGAGNRNLCEITPSGYSGCEGI